MARGINSFAFGLALAAIVFLAVFLIFSKPFSKTADFPSPVVSATPLVPPVFEGGPESRAIDFRLFGMHGIQSGAELAIAAGVKTHRVEFFWENYNPQKGVFRDSAFASRAFDEAIISSQMPIVMSFEPTHPVMGNLDANSKSDGVFRYYGYPSDMPAWLEMVSRIVEKLDCDGVDDAVSCVESQKVEYWQIGNEWFWQWADSNENYLKFFRETRQAILKSDPKAKIVGPAVTGPEALAVRQGYFSRKDWKYDERATGRKLDFSRESDWKPVDEAIGRLDFLIENAGLELDALDVHFYTVDPHNIPKVMAWLFDKRKKLSPNASFEFWSLEHAGPFKWDITDEEFASQVVQRYVLGSHAGLSRIYWNGFLPSYPPWPKPYEQLNLLNASFKKSQSPDRVYELYDLKPTPAYYSYKLAAEKFAGKTIITKVDLGSSNIFVFKLSNAKGEAVFVGWTQNGTQKISVEGNEVKITDIVTQRGQTEPETEELVFNSGNAQIILTKEPIFFEVE